MLSNGEEDFPAYNLGKSCKPPTFPLKETKNFDDSWIGAEEQLFSGCDLSDKIMMIRFVAYVSFLYVGAFFEDYVDMAWNLDFNTGILEWYYTKLFEVWLELVMIWRDIHFGNVW